MVSSPITDMQYTGVDGGTGEDDSGGADVDGGEDVADDPDLETSEVLRLQRLPAGRGGMWCLPS